MAKGAVTKLKLDTDQAHRDLKELAREGEAPAGRLNRKGKGAGKGGGGGAFGKGFGAGAGFALGKKIAGSVGFFSSVGDIASDAFSGISADIDTGLGAQLSRAKKAAREETVQSMSMQTYHANNADGAKQFYNNILRNKHKPLQQGASEIRKATGGSRGLDPDLKTPFDKITSNVTDAIKDGFSKLQEALGGG